MDNIIVYCTSTYSNTKCFYHGLSSTDPVPHIPKASLLGGEQMELLTNTSSTHSNSGVFLNQEKEDRVLTGQLQVEYFKDGPRKVFAGWICYNTSQSIFS